MPSVDTAGESGAARVGRQEGALYWDLRRNCSLTPRQCLASLSALAAITVAVALALWAAGFPLVALFAAMEVGAIALALVQYARHARDGETVTLDGGCVEIRSLNGGSASTERFDACWVTVERARCAGDPIVLRQCGRVVQLGRQVRPARRRAIEQELRGALLSR